MRPPEGVLFKHLVLLEILPYTPSFVIGQSQPVLLKQCVDSWHASVPRVLQVVQRESPVLRLRLFALQGVLRPYALAVDVF